MEVVPAQEVCEYTYKVELIEVNKISLVVFNTTTGIKYQRYIEEYSELWEDLKLNFQHNFSLCFKMLTKALLDKDQGFNVSILHNIDFVVLQLSYINDLLGFTIDISVNQYKKDNLQESVNVLDYKQKLLEDENKSLKSEIKHIHEEVTELKRIINLLGDGFSYDNRFSTVERYYKCDIQGCAYSRDTKCIPKIQYSANFHNTSQDQAQQMFLPRNVGPTDNPLLTRDVINKLCSNTFTDLIKKYNIDYDIKEGYDWVRLGKILSLGGHVDERSIHSLIIDYMNKHYDLTWKSFKELFDITI